MPNIFKYATSELSQDAMIAWLMACAKPEEDEALREVGQSFIRFLLGTPCNGVESAVLDGNGKLRPYDGAGLVSHVRVTTQYKHMDVYCSAKIDDKLVSFVIESKTGTTDHSNQLERYRQAAQSDDIDEHYLKLIYLKTGMPFEDELRRAEEASYCHVGVHNLNCFLNSKAVNTTSDLLQQYLAHIAELTDKQNEADRDWNMDWGPIQYKFAQKLKALTEKGNGSDEIWKWRNRGGGYWTQYRFSSHHLFWRMDTHGDLRMMVDTRKGRSSGDIHQYRKAFCRACDGVELVSLSKFRRRPGSEMTVGSIQYPASETKDWGVERKIGEQNFGAFLQSIAQVHERFLQELAQIQVDNAAS